MCRVAVSVCLVVVLGTATGAPGPGGREVRSYAAGTAYVVAVTDAAIKAAPAWKADRDSPDLPPRKAVELAAKAVGKITEGRKDYTWETNTVALVPYQGDYWYWVVEFRPVPTFPSTGSAGSLRVVVLMDGTVPVVRPEGK